MADSPGQAAPSQTTGMTAQGRYTSLEASRSPFLLRARTASAYTIPGLFPPEGANGGTNYETPFQSIGARGINNLGSKLLLAILPPGSSFFRLTLDDFVVAKLAKKFAADPKLGEDARATLEEALGRIERAVCNRLEQVGARTVVFEALKQLLVAGNALVQVLPTGKLMLHILSNYVVKRDMSGNVLEIVVKQTLSRMSLPPKVLAILDAEDETERNDKSGEKNVDLYTRISRRAQDNGTELWETYQEACGKIVPDTQGTYPIDKTPWLPLRFTHITNEDYGRGFVEEYQGDMSSLESLTEAVVRFSVVAAKVVYLVDESGTTDKNRIAKARSGDVLDGNAKDVTAVTLEKYNDFKVTKEVADGIQHRLEQAFLLDTAVQRDAERVTAEEIRLLANSLEMGLGGFYSILGEEFQRPLVSVMMAQMERERKLPVLPKQAVNPSIVTGLEALGRNADLQRLDVLLQGLAQNFGPPVVAQYVDVGGYLKRRGTALGIDMTGLIRSDDDVQAQINQQQQQELAAKLGPHAIKAASDQQQAAAQNGPPQQAPPQQ
jgi:hypothetical protein